MEKTIKENEVKIFKIDDVSKYLPKIVRTYENAAFCEEVAENGEETFAVGYGDEIVGLAYIEDEEDEGFIYVYIFEEYRRKGFGSAAVCAAEKSLKASPPKITTGYVEKNEAVKRFARAHGYEKWFCSAVMRYDGGAFDLPELPIREYKDEDYNEAFALSAEAFHRMRLSTGFFPDSTVSQPSEESRKRWAESDEDQYVYVADGEIIGYGDLDGTEIDTVSIKIPHQGRGYGRAFVMYLVNRVLEKNDGAPTLWCVVGNVKARRLYESLGFKEVGRAEYAVKKSEK